MTSHFSLCRRIEIEYTHTIAELVEDEVDCCDCSSGFLH